MCGIVGAIAQKNIVDLLITGLKRLEYRGYDSAGLAIIPSNYQNIQCQRVMGKVSKLEAVLKTKTLAGHIGIAHTRWATHGNPSKINAHPHCSQGDVALVHNGIIENYQYLKQQLITLGYQFNSETDTEVIAHLIHYYLQQNHDPMHAIHQAISQLDGTYALGIIIKQFPEYLFAVRSGSPLIIGLGADAHFIASDPLALLPFTQRFIYLKEGDIAKITSHKIAIENSASQPVEREVHHSKIDMSTTSKGPYRHFMLKEIFEQPEAINNTLQEFLINDQILLSAFGHQAESTFKKIKRIRIIACGTSYHAGLVAQHWFESLSGIPCQVEIASEYRYRHSVIEPDTLFIALSQSGETADTLAALYQAKQQGYMATLAICNVPESSLTREAELVFITRAGAEVGVAATKTFTTQLVALLLLSIMIGQYHWLTDKKIKDTINTLKQLPELSKKILSLDPVLKTLAKQFDKQQSVIFLGRGEQYAIALEGALKLKEISYLHAQGYPAGELKHGPLALVDKKMAIIVLAPKNHLSNKLASNVQEIQARKGQIYIFSDHRLEWAHKKNLHIIDMPIVPEILSPILYVMPLQLLSYHIAALKGTNIDQPRNLAKSVTVE